MFVIYICKFILNISILKNVDIMLQPSPPPPLPFMNFVHVCDFILSCFVIKEIIAYKNMTLVYVTYKIYWLYVIWYVILVYVCDVKYLLFIFLNFIWISPYKKKVSIMMQPPSLALSLLNLLWPLNFLDS